MKPENSNPPTKPATQRAPNADAPAKKNLDLNLKAIVPKLKKLKQLLATHFTFIIVMFVLLMYLFVVWNISKLVNAEPSEEAETQALTTTNLPRIDQKIINQIQSLENNSPAVRSLFNQARNNPFHE